MFSERTIADFVRPEQKVRLPHDYYCLVGPDEWRVVDAVPIRRLLLSNPDVIHESFMSLRLGTGIIGELDCPSGNNPHAPKNEREVILGFGARGIDALVSLGALPCISCHSGDRLGQLYPEIAAVNDRQYLIDHYDARLLDWSRILPLGLVPNKFYTRPGLTHAEVDAIKDIFVSRGLDIPSIGYYDRSSVDHFFMYNGEV